MTMDETTLKVLRAMSREEQAEMLAASLAYGCGRACLRREDLMEMDRHLREWYGDERANLAALSLGIAVAVGFLTADGYRLMAGDKEIVESALSDLAKIEEPMALRFFEGEAEGLDPRN